MASRSQTPAGYESPSDPEHIRPGYGSGAAVNHAPAEATDEAQPNAALGEPAPSSPLARSVERRDFEPGSRRDDSPAMDGDANRLGRDTSVRSSGSVGPSRSGTLKKRNSLSRKSSLKRSDSKASASAHAESGKSIILGHGEKFVVGDEDNMRSVYFTPVPTSGTPTEILANRFSAWRKVLKDLIAYYREVQTSYEHRAKSIMKVSGVVGNAVTPGMFLPEGRQGLADATEIIRDFHRRSVSEANKAKEVEDDVILSLTGLRSDLQQKIKEIRSLSSDFKNSVEKEMDNTRKAVHALQDAIENVEAHPAEAVGKGDPFLVRMTVERQVEKQLDEENYLHRAYLNLEGSGRELESIVVGEIQKSYNALAGILRRDADEAYDTIDRLRNGPLAMSRDHEWALFVEKDPRFVDPKLPLRNVGTIEYPGKYSPTAAEVRSGMLERKSKYLKSYTPGWYVLSPTHLHEFRSPDQVHLQTPGMSLFLPDQKLGSQSQPGSSSHKFIVKGRQTGAMHRGHTWVFRAESHETMLAWYEAIKNLTEKTGKEREAFVRRHARSMSNASQTAPSVDSDGALDEDEADEVPYAAGPSSLGGTTRQEPLARPQPGGRFPSDLHVGRGLREARSSSSASSDRDPGVVAVSGPGSTSTDPAHAADPGRVKQERSILSPLRSHPTQAIAPDDNNGRLETRVPVGGTLVEQSTDTRPLGDESQGQALAGPSTAVVIGQGRSEREPKFKEEFGEDRLVQVPSDAPAQPMAGPSTAALIGQGAPQRDASLGETPAQGTPVELAADGPREQAVRPTGAVPGPITADTAVPQPQQETTTSPGTVDHPGVISVVPWDGRRPSEAQDHDVATSPDVTPLSEHQLQAIVANASPAGADTNPLTSQPPVAASRETALLDDDQGARPYEPQSNDPARSSLPPTNNTPVTGVLGAGGAPGPQGEPAVSFNTTHDPPCRPTQAIHRDSSHHPAPGSTKTPTIGDTPADGPSSTSASAAAYRSPVEEQHRADSSTSVPVTATPSRNEGQAEAGAVIPEKSTPARSGQEEEAVEQEEVTVTQTIVTREVHKRTIIAADEDQPGPTTTTSAN